ncbi:MAG: sigma factor-like helix-turn-helix DNA-binding protein [Actinomycetota bacterium]|nr:sigma factor-like helix-turn-helix DNA-binding protein [Actinomycetota bacterium]
MIEQSVERPSRRDSFETFFAETEPKLRQALCGGFGAERGREATAEALAQGWQRWDRVKGMDNPEGYLYRIGERWARAQERRHLGLLRREPSASPGHPEFEPGLDPALAALSRRQRQVVLLVVGFGLTHAETASLLELSRSSVQIHLERGLAKLRTALGVDQ